MNYPMSDSENGIHAGAVIGWQGSDIEPADNGSITDSDTVVSHDYQRDIPIATTELNVDEEESMGWVHYVNGETGDDGSITDSESVVSQSDVNACIQSLETM